MVSFRARTCNALMGPFRNEMKDASCLELYSEQLLFERDFKNICINNLWIRGQRFVIIPNYIYVTYDLDYRATRSRVLR